MTATFIEDLQEKIDAFADIISSRNVHAGSKVQATASIDEVLDEAMLDVRELDPAVENAIGDDKPLLEAWRSAGPHRAPFEPQTETNPTGTSNG